MKFSSAQLSTWVDNLRKSSPADTNAPARASKEAAPETVATNGGVNAKTGADVLTEACKEKYRAILTFDDGPEPTSALESILHTLAKHSVVATFYVLGEEVISSPGAAKSILKGGHRVESHSWDHTSPGLTRLKTQAEIKENLNKAQEAIKLATGSAPTRMRPPFGNRNKLVYSAAQELGLLVTLWDIDTNDWRAPKGLKENKYDPQKATWKGLYTKKKVPLDILMHVQQQTAADLDAFIASMKSDCWEFVNYSD